MSVGNIIALKTLQYHCRLLEANGFKNIMHGSCCSERRFPLSLTSKARDLNTGLGTVPEHDMRLDKDRLLRKSKNHIRSDPAATADP